MRPRYLALSGDLAAAYLDKDSAGSNDLAGQAMRPCGVVGDLALFASHGMPTLSLPGGGLVMGELYDHAGMPITGPRGLPWPGNQQALREHVLRHYWGQYVLFQPSDTGCEGATVLRDPSGMLACAYALDDAGRGFVTSDLGLPVALGLHRPGIDWEFVRHCLVYPRMKIGRTGQADVRELLPGNLLTIQSGPPSTSQAWSPWTFVAPDRRIQDPAAAAHQVQHAIAQAVRAMANTDGALLLELSGGLDSSIVGACLEGTHARVSCCTAITPLPGADERHYAQQVAMQLGIELQQQPLGFDESGISFALAPYSLRPAAWALGRIVARAMDEAAESRHVLSHFSGSGGDTVFGYLATAAPAVDALRGQGLGAATRTIVDLARLHGCTVAHAAWLSLRKLCITPKPAIHPDPSLLQAGVAAPALEYHPWFQAPANALAGDRERIFDLAGNQLFVDATERAGGRKVRMPLLSQPVLEACLSIPSWLWVAQGRNRAVARSAFAKALPADVLERRSKGTFMNYTAALYRRNKQEISHFLGDGMLQSHRLLDTSKLNDALDQPLPPRDRSFMRIFDLCMIENWLRNQT